MKYRLNYKCRDCHDTVSTNIDLNSNIDDLLCFLRSFNFECEGCFSTVGSFSAEEDPPKSKHDIYWVNPVSGRKVKMN